MPLPKPTASESREEFIDRCMGNSEAISEFGDEEQRLAVCENLFKEHNMSQEEPTKNSDKDETSKDKDAKGILASVPKEPKETKSFTLEVKGMDTDKERNVAIIKGYGSTFGNVDLGNDIVEKGAFKKTLQEKNVFPFLEDHTPRMKNLLGFCKVWEDNKGLYGEFEINLETDQGKSAYALAKQASALGDDLGMSIGYEVIQDEFDRKNGVRRLKELKLFEVSMVMFPMNEEAGVTEAKSRKEEVTDALLEIKEYINSLRDNEPSDGTLEFEAEVKQLITEIKTIGK